MYLDPLPCSTVEYRKGRQSLLTNRRAEIYCEAENVKNKKKILYIFLQDN